MSAYPSLLFSPFRLELGNDQLWKEDKTVPLRRKTLAVLRYLMEHPGQLVTKEHVLATVWSGTYVEEGALTICIAELRKALGDNAKTPRFIETVHGRGYRFLPTVTTQPAQGAKVRGPSAKPQDSGLSTQPSLLVGRESELAQLHGWLDKALSGERQLVFVTGEPGIGKTTLVDAFLSGVGQQGTGNGKEERPQAKSQGQKGLIPDPRSPIPGLAGGSASSSMALASRICRSWKPWDDSAAHRMGTVLSPFSDTMPRRGWCSCPRC